MPTPDTGSEGRSRRQQVGSRQKWLLLLTLIRDQELFLSLKDELRPDHFGSSDFAMAVVWAAMLSFYATHHRAPDINELLAQVQQRYEADMDSFAPGDLDKTDTLIATAYEMDVSEFRPDTVRVYAAQLLEEHLQQTLRSQLEGDAVVDLPALLQRHAERAMSVRSLAATTHRPSFGARSVDELVGRPPAVIKETTGCQFFDSHMNGGHAPGEVYLFGAPFGVGKTTIAVQLAVNKAKLEIQRWQANGRRGSPRIIYLAVWEEEWTSLQIRAMSCWAQVPKDTLEAADYNSLSRGSDMSTLKPYELTRYQAAIRNNQRVLGERDRLDRTLRYGDDCIQFLDFTGQDQSRMHQASNMTLGILDAINAHQRYKGNPGVAMVIADHAMAAVDTFLDARPNLNRDREKRHLLGNFPRALKMHIANRFNCPVWLMQQLNTESQNKAAGVIPKLTDFAEAKNIGQYVNFAFIMGQKNEQGLCVIYNVKHRRTEGTLVPSIVHIDGNFCTIRSTGSRYRVDGSRIVLASEMYRLQQDPDVIPERSSRAAMLNRDRDIGL